MANKNIMRRSLGVLICSIPILLLLASLVHGKVEVKPSIMGVGFLVAALGIGLLNTHTSFIRPKLHYRRHGSMEGYRHVSGIPFVGTISTVIATIGNFGSVPAALLGLLALALDTGGLPWFLISTWRDSSFWDT